MHGDHHEYFKFTGKSRLDKSINSLLGLIQGIAIDGLINKSELKFLNLWLDEHRDVKKTHPYNEIFPVVQKSIADGVLTDEERKDIIWLCENLRSTKYFDTITADIQKLHAILGGINADNIISEKEIENLAVWLSEHENLKTCWPYDEVDSLVTSILANKKLDDNKLPLLKTFCSEFVSIFDERTITNPSLSIDTSVVGLCTMCPQIKFPESLFCFTGASFKYTRQQFTDIVEKRGGKVIDSVTLKLNYLIIGADGNPCWTYACYGRKVEKAIELRKGGSKLLIVHENDFHDAIAADNSFS